MDNAFKIKKGLIVNASGSTAVDIQGNSGQLFSITDSLTGVLMSVNDISGLPILEVSDNDQIKMGTFGDEALIISGNTANITGSLFGTATTATTATQTSQAVTFNNGGSGAASGATFNGSTAITVSHNTIGAVPTGRTLTGGDGIQTIGNLTADRTIAVDSTVVRTSGNQTVGGVKTFSDATPITLSASTATVNFGNTGPRIVNLFADATSNNNTKIINLGTGGVSGSKTTINLGSSTADAISTVQINNLLVYNSAQPNNSASGEVTYAFGGSDFDIGNLVIMKAGNWSKANATSVGGAEGLLGIALGTTGADGVLLRGFARFDSAFPVPPSTGIPCYVGTSSSAIQYSAPSGSGNIVRIVGYSTGTGEGIYFCPDNTWVEIA